jgi:formamidopyrimidine-DNA glycosylase
VPELPEVETIRRGLQEHLPGRTIQRVETSGKKLRGAASPVPLKELEGRRIERIDRQAKFLLLRIDDGSTLLLHLGMSGKILLHDPAHPAPPHTHLRLLFDNYTELRFVDPRRFGATRLHPTGPIKELEHYGMDALDPRLTPEHLEGLLQQSRAPLKSFLLDQTKIAGLGNIYAIEALWRARLSPRRSASNTPRSRIPLLLEGIQGVLQDSLRNGGTTFNDYANTLGDPGGNLPFLAVFQKAGLPCPRCKQPIKRIVQSGRSTFYCGTCQR